MKNLKVTIIQSDLYWENRTENLKQFSEKIDTIKESTDLIILPEMFTTGFSMNTVNFADTMSGETMGWMKEKAKQKKCVLTGSFICEENGNYYNRLVWMKPDGTYHIYDKRHLFRMAGEDAYYTSGKKKVIMELNGWKICPLICYDLRFPVWSRNKAKSSTFQVYGLVNTYDYDLLIYVANWPEKRIHPWKTLLLARAIENQCYVVGLNRIGDDTNQIHYSGDSVVVNPQGEIISKIKANEESVETVELNFLKLQEYRESFPAHLDADDFELK